MDFLQRPQACWDKVRLEKQILRGIPSENELWGQNDFRSTALKGAAGILNLTCVAGEVTDGRVDLCESDFHDLPKSPLAGGHNVNAQAEIGDRMGQNASR